MNCNCENCGWSEIVGSPIMCNYNGHRTWRDECCEAWKPKETDMVEVVRCKDCKHKEKSGSPYFPLWCNRLHCGCDNDWFCADGERKEGR